MLQWLLRMRGFSLDFETAKGPFTLNEREKGRHFQMGLGKTNLLFTSRIDKNFKNVIEPLGTIFMWRL